MVKERIIEEKKGYGLGRILGRIQLPIQEGPQQQVQQQQVLQLVEQQQDQQQVPHAQVQQHVQGEAPHVQGQENPKEFMLDFITLMNSLGANLSMLGTKLKRAQELFPNNSLVKNVEEFMGKRS
ncbi:uncharacterized protein [Spinacia oleracea]|uniref:Uncharacterized protein n=1 Tax=Spinacia oleracea TaxID=3562 RepID=A0ABM3RIV5_SPIOL|nr:uncharacterized protein LOC130470020 [Spinacia oleracea]